MNNPYSTNPDDLGITVIGAITTNPSETTQQELEQKAEDIKKILRSKKAPIMDEFWTAQKSKALDQLHEKNPPFKAGSAK